MTGNTLKKFLSLPEVDNLRKSKKFQKLASLAISMGTISGDNSLRKLGSSLLKVSTNSKLFEFTRCVRPDGTAYGTSGKCRKGTEESDGGRRARGQSLEGTSLDVKKLMSRAEDWRKTLGLSGEDNLQEHDAIHVLVKDYLGKDSEKIAKLLGGRGKGPSVLEEILVEAFTNSIRFSPENRKKFFSGEEISSLLGGGLRNNIEGTLRIVEGLGFLDSSSPLVKRKERSINSIVRTMKVLSQRSDFDKFIETLSTLRKST